MAMNNVLVLIFALLDSGAWDIRQLRSWADGLISKLNHPGGWLIELSVADDMQGAMDVVTDAMRIRGISLPSGIGDLLAGIILLRLDAGDLTVSKARSELIDVIDAYDVRYVDAEAAQEIDLTDQRFAMAREIASSALRYLGSSEMISADRTLLED